MTNVDDSLVIVETFPTRRLAQMAGQLLDEAGIPFIIQADDEGGVHPALGMVSGARVLVSSEHLERAREAVAPLRSTD